MIKPASTVCKLSAFYVLFLFLGPCFCFVFGYGDTRLTHCPAISFCLILTSRSMLFLSVFVLFCFFSFALGFACFCLFVVVVVDRNFVLLGSSFFFFVLFFFFFWGVSFFVLLLLLLCFVFFRLRCLVLTPCVASVSRSLWLSDAEFLCLAGWLAVWLPVCLAGWLAGSVSLCLSASVCVAFYLSEYVYACPPPPSL